MSKQLSLTFAVALLSALPGTSANAGECLSQPVDLYTTRDFYLQEGGSELLGCIRNHFPAETSLVAGYTPDEGQFGQSDPFAPESWNSLSGLALAIETCYQVATWPNFPPGTCGHPMHPIYEGMLEPNGLIGQDWVMRWYLVCGTPQNGTFEYRVPIVRISHCEEPQPLFDDEFEN